jgi:hypothetical protein
MSIPIYVDGYSGDSAIQYRQSFTLDEEIYEIAAVLDRWYEPSAMYFKAQSTEARPAARSRREWGRVDIAGWLR